MAVGGLLMFTRIVPIFAILPENMAFPPETTADLVRLVVVAGSRWQLSHVLGLVAVSLFTIGYWLHATVLAKLGTRRVGIAAAGTATIAFGLFAVALLLDGFHVSATAAAYASNTGGSMVTLEDVAKAHEQALLFFTPGVFLMFVAMGLLASRMLHRFIHSRWLGGLGQLVAIAAVTAFLFGVTGPNWNNMRIGGSAMMAGFVWHLLVGLSALFKPAAGGRKDGLRQSSVK